MVHRDSLRQADLLFSLACRIAHLRFYDDVKPVSSICLFTHCLLRMRTIIVAVTVNAKFSDCCVGN